MRKKTQATMPRKKSFLLLLVEMGLWVILSLAMYQLWNRWLIPGTHAPVRWVGMDFVPYWVGVRAMLSGQSPYSSEISHLIQEVLLSGPAAAGSDPMMFVYPAWLFLIILPFALLPLHMAIASWTGLLLLGVFNLIGYLALRWGARKPSRIALWTIVLAIGSLPYLSIAVTKGQLSLMSLGSLFLVIHIISNFSVQDGHKMPAKSENGNICTRSDPWSILAGILIALATLKPTQTVFAVGGVLIWAVIARKKSLIASFLASMGILTLSSLLMIGNWIPDYFAMLKNAGGASILWSLSSILWPWKGVYAAYFLIIASLGLVRFIKTRKNTQWFSASILTGLALLPMRWIYDLQLGVLIPAETFPTSTLSIASIVIALLAPYGFAVLPESIRWSAQVIGMPLFWSLTWITCFLLPARIIIKEQP